MSLHSQKESCFKYYIKSDSLNCKAYLDFIPIGSLQKESTWNAGDTGGAVSSLGWEDPLEEEMETHSSILVWKIPWTEEPGGLQFMGLQRVRHDWVVISTRLEQGTLLDLWSRGKVGGGVGGFPIAHSGGREKIRKLFPFISYLSPSQHSEVLALPWLQRFSAVLNSSHT